VLQVRRNGLESRGSIVAIVAIPPAPLGADPVTGMHLQSGRARADHLTALAPDVTGSADRLESASSGRQRWITGQRSKALPPEAWHPHQRQ
jgi:hypothetical protein